MGSCIGAQAYALEAERDALGRTTFPIAPPHWLIGIKRVKLRRPRDRFARGRRTRSGQAWPPGLYPPRRTHVHQGNPLAKPPRPQLCTLATPSVPCVGFNAAGVTQLVHTGAAL